MKYAPKKVFILENGLYKEITYSELKQLEQADNDGIFQLPIAVKCPVCGDIIKRRCSRRKKGYSQWRCKNSECDNTINKNDDFSSKNEEYKPISMIITTLAAQSYNGENDIYDFICSALLKMPTLVEKSGDEYVIRNPVMSKENFADKWKETPQKATGFFNWINDAYVDFINLKDLTTYAEVDRVFKEIFSQKPVDRLMQKYSVNTRGEKVFFSTGMEKADALTSLNRISYRKAPPWALPRAFRVVIQGKVSYDSGNTYQDFTSDKILPKNVLLRFFPIHSIQPPYDVKWQITNTGNEAKIAGGLRGDKFENSELRLNGILCGKKESTSYTGMHYIQCFIIKNGNQCVGMSKPFVVNIQQ